MNVIKTKFNNRGETLAEILISVLIIAAALVMLSSIILASSNMVDKGNKQMSVVYDGENKLELGTSNSSVSQITLSGETFNGLSSQINVKFYKDDDTGLINYSKGN